MPDLNRKDLVGAARVPPAQCTQNLRLERTYTSIRVYICVRYTTSVRTLRLKCTHSCQLQCTYALLAETTPIFPSECASTTATYTAPAVCIHSSRSVRTLVAVYVHFTFSVHTPLLQCTYTSLVVYIRLTCSVLHTPQLYYRHLTCSVLPHLQCTYTLLAVYIRLSQSVQLISGVSIRLAVSAKAPYNPRSICIKLFQFLDCCSVALHIRSKSLLGLCCVDLQQRRPHVVAEARFSVFHVRSSLQANTLCHVFVLLPSLCCTRRVFSACRWAAQKEEVTIHALTGNRSSLFLSCFRTSPSSWASAFNHFTPAGNSSYAFVFSGFLRGVSSEKRHTDVCLLICRTTAKKHLRREKH